MAGQEDSNGCINYEGKLSRARSLLGWGGGLGILGFYPWLPRAEALLLTLFFFPAFVKHIMAS